MLYVTIVNCLGCPLARGYYREKKLVFQCFHPFGPIELNEKDMDNKVNKLCPLKNESVQFNFAELEK